MAKTSDSVPHAFSRTRSEALADGIFAISMTLLVLNLEAPTITMEDDNGEMLAALLKLWPHLVAYVLSFISLGIYWVAHHNIFHHVVKTDRVVLWLNILWLMLVSFLPFSASLYSEYFHNQIAVIVYSLNTIAIGIVVYSLWSYVRSRSGFIYGISERKRATIQRLLLMMPAVSILAIVASFWRPYVTAIIFGVFLPLVALVPIWMERRESELDSVEE